MASVTKVGDKWRALVRRKGYPSYCKTFKVKKQADAWAYQVESDIERGNAPALQSVVGRSLRVSEVIAAYRKLREGSRPISDASTEHYTLKHLADGLGERDVMALNAQDLVGYCQMRCDEGAGPYTCNMDISKLGTAMRYAAMALKVTLPDVVASARPLLTHLGLIGGGGKRERRPTEDELVHLTTWLAKERGELYADVVRFAVATAMRRGEIVKLLWADVDRVKRLVLVRDRKDPRKKTGNDQWVPLLPPAWALLERLVHDDDEPRIFPVHEQTLSKYFLEACRALSIPDLHLHDCRHHAISLLFEEGMTIPEVALVSGHKSWNQLKTYTNLKPEDLVTRFDELPNSASSQQRNKRRAPPGES